MCQFFYKFLAPKFKIICIHFGCGNGHNNGYFKGKMKHLIKPTVLIVYAIKQTDCTIFKVTPPFKVTPVYGALNCHSGLILS